MISKGGNLEALVRNTQRLIDGYISLSTIDKPKLLEEKRRELHFSELGREPAHIRSFPDILRRGAFGNSTAGLPAVLTRCPRLDKLARYDDGSSSSKGGGGTEVVRVHAFENRFSVADSGLSRPMILSCIGTDGRRYRQVSE